MLEALKTCPEFVAATGLHSNLNEFGFIEFDHLSPNYCYIMGFKHPNIHCTTKEAGIWYISHHIIDTNMGDDAKVINIVNLLPKQKKLEFSSGPGDIKSLWQKFPSEYGYVIKTTDGNSSYLLESDLMKKIRLYAYNIRKINGLNHGNRLRFIIVRAYLNKLIKR